MAYTFSDDTILQCIGDVVLTNNVIKSGGSRFAIEGLGHGGSLALQKNTDKVGMKDEL